MKYSVVPTRHTVCAIEAWSQRHGARGTEREAQSV
jgi:hypothetical protein